MSVPSTPPVHAGTVYFVDDDPEMCAVVDVELSDLGFTVRTFTAADGLLEALRTDDPDVIVTDLRMRKMNGLELCERVVNNRRDVPVVVVTAFGSMDLAISAMRVGAYDFITKPFGMEALAVSPTQYLVVPRVLALIFVMPLLTMLFVYIGFLGAFAVSVYQAGIDEGTFMGRIGRIVELSDLLGGLFKSAVFGGIIGIVACHKGMSASGGSKGVGLAATSTVVSCSVLILVVDYLLTTAILHYFGA